MRTLILARHAKSDWGDAALADHDRPLNGRGRRDAPVMARRLADSGPEVQRILSSTALRARTTAEAFGAQLGLPVELDRELYLSSPSTLLEKAAAGAAGAAGSVMVVAHNPGITELAWLLSEGGIAHMPTCAVARFEWQADSRAAAASRPADSWSLDTPR